MGLPIEQVKRYLANLDATANPARSLEFFVPSPFQDSWDLLARRVELDPSRAFLVLGTMGSGKTTQLWRMKENLGSIGEYFVHYLDTSQTSSKVTIKGYEPGIPGLVSVVVAMATELYSGQKKFSFSSKREALETVQEFLNPRDFFLIDGQDRAPLAGDTLREDISLLRESRLGFLMTGSVDFSFSNGMHVLDLFDRVERHQIVDVIGDPRRAEILREMIRLRVPDREFLPEDVISFLVEKSGGVLRDMFLLARDAVEEAWLAGKKVSLREAWIASRHLSDRLLTFAQQRPERLDLLTQGLRQPFRSLASIELQEMARRNLLLERESGGLRTFEVHPLLAEVLRQEKVAE